MFKPYNFSKAKLYKSVNMRDSRLNNRLWWFKEWVEHPLAGCLVRVESSYGDSTMLIRAEHLVEAY